MNHEMSDCCYLLLLLRLDEFIPLHFVIFLNCADFETRNCRFNATRNEMTELLEIQSLFNKVILGLTLHYNTQSTKQI